MLSNFRSTRPSLHCAFHTVREVVSRTVTAIVTFVKLAVAVTSSSSRNLYVAGCSSLVKLTVAVTAVAVNIAVFSEKTDVPHLPNQSMVAISVMKL